jgi:putative sigma-54 modulation protein
MIKMNIKATNFSVTPAIQDYIEKRLGVLERHVRPDDESARADIEIGRTTKHHKGGEIFRAEVNLHVAGKNFFAESEKEDLYVAIDDLKDEVSRKLASWKDKRIGFIRRGGRKIKDMVRGVYSKRGN